MIHITEKRECCGCSACILRCPKRCITLREDAEGFLYPEVDKERCIDCGLCEKVCPWQNRAVPVPPLEVLAVKNRNEEERLDSSSGGVFIALAKAVIRKGGVVFGAVFDRRWEVIHAYAESMEGVRRMMGSKYVQSHIGNSYKEAEQFLKQGREVLFCGTPCQIAGLHSFLHKPYSNLLSVDFLCHGVPSPGVWRRYLVETFSISARRAAAGKNTVLSSSLNDMPVITGIAFRDKKLHGWKKFSFVVRGKSASKADKNSVLLSAKHFENPFMRGFLSNLYLRPSCYHCRCKNGVSHSDLTIADYWGIHRLMSDFDDDKGVGLVLLNTGKGESLFHALDMETRISTLGDAMRFNGGFKEDARQNPKREDFFAAISTGRTVEEAVEICLYVPMFIRLWHWGKRKVKACVTKTLRMRYNILPPNK